MIPYFSLPYVTVGTLSLPTFPLALALSVVGMGVAFFSEAERKELPLPSFFKLFLFWVAGTLIGARLGALAGNEEYFLANPFAVFDIGLGGGIELGGFFGGLTLGLGYIFFFKLPWKKSLDAVAPALALRLALVRIGCTAIHDHIGKVMEYPWPWGIAYQGAIRHEIGMYSLFAMSFIFLFLWVVRKRIEKISGALFSLYLMLYAFFAFVIYFFREERITSIFDTSYYGLSVAQYAVLAVFTFGGLLLIKFFKAGNVQNSFKNV